MPKQKRYGLRGAVIGILLSIVLFKFFGQSTGGASDAENMEAVALWFFLGFGTTVGLLIGWLYGKTKK